MNNNDLVSIKSGKQIDKFNAVREQFKDGDYVVGVGKHKGCSQVFTEYGVTQPFSYLNDYDPANFRLATDKEVNKADAKWAKHLNHD